MTASVHGLVGIVTRLPSVHVKRELQQMLNSMHHHAADVGGFFADETLGAYLGWISRPHPSAAAMPLCNETCSVVLVTSGEDFPDPSITQQLRERGHNLSQQDSAHLPHVYEEENSFPTSLNGRFHGFLIDRDRSVAMLYNDRYGIHRIYYYETEDAFYFAAEAKAILAVRPELRTINLKSLGEFISCGAVLENHTLFQELSVLPGASRWEFRNGTLSRKTTYFHPSEWEQQDSVGIDEYYANLREVFTTSLPRYLSSQQVIGMSLTGGLDTRMILSNRSFEPGSISCYTYGSMYRDHEDVRIARQLASACHQQHQVIIAGEEFLSEFSKYAEETVFLSDGCVDVGRSPDLYLSRLACQIAPVRMTGLYGGEVLRGVRGFKPVHVESQIYSQDLFPFIEDTKQTYAQLVQTHPVTFAAFRQAPWYNYGSLAIEQTQLSMRTPFLDNEFIRTAYRSPLSALTNSEISLRLIADGNPSLLRIPTDRGMSLQSATPMQAARHAALEFLFKAEYAYDMGMPQWLARLDHKVAPLKLQRAFLGRHKPFHFRVWYRDSLCSYLRDTLLNQRSLSRDHINPKSMRAIVEGHLSGKQNHTVELHKLLTIELIYRLFTDSVHAPSSSLTAATPPPSHISLQGVATPQ